MESDSSDGEFLQHKPVFTGKNDGSNVKAENPTIIATTAPSTEQLPFLHRRVAKEFDGLLYFGRVTEFIPAQQTEEGESDLWTVVYEDGDLEDMDASELQRHLLEEEEDEHENFENTEPSEAVFRRVTASPEGLDSTRIINNKTPTSVVEGTAEEPIELESDEQEKQEDRKPSPLRKRPRISYTLVEEEENEASEEEDVEEERKPSPMRKRIRISYKSDEEEEEASEQDKTDEDATSRRKARIRNRMVEKYATLEQKAWLGYGSDEYSEEEDSDDESILAEEGFHLAELAEPRSRHCRGFDDFYDCAPPPLPPVALTSEQVKEMLQQIDDPADQALQKLLLDEDFQFLLLPHQFLAVRSVAGVPSTFPIHDGSKVTEPVNATMAQAIVGMDSDNNKCKTKGVLIADEMGLGKTVEAIAGAVLRNALAAANGKKKRPTVIIGPNDAVLIQWRDTLINNGVPMELIQMFAKGQHSKDFDKAIFLLMTRYTLQAEVKRVFGNLDHADKYPHLAKSVLFCHARIDNLQRLKLQYMDDNSKVRVINKIRDKGENIGDCVTRLIRLCSLRMRGKEPIFETVIIDEAHFLKNRTTFWGIGASLIATHSLRSAPLTGTPYNNGPSDLAAMMTFIDPHKGSAFQPWWASATKDYAGETICNKIKLWHETYLVRRRKEDVLTDLMPKRVKSQIVPQYLAEMCVYDQYEGILQHAMKDFSQLIGESENPIVRERLKELFTILMALMSNMRSANIHAMLPGGREYTKQFSPSRQHLRAMEERSKSCVCCDQSMRPSIPVASDDDDGNGNKRGKQRRLRSKTNVDELAEGEEVNDDAVEMIREEEEELVPLPCSLCGARDGDVSHFAHADCIEKLKAESESCPRCKHAQNTMNFVLPNEGSKRYCKNIDGGFIGSSKINAVVDWYQNEVPEDDKVLILSFFKGGLDLLEGAFTYDFGINCARFDGDVDRRTSLAELERFKADPDCKILLATVQSGGVGLNIVEANHCAFIDRSFNPFVHQQAEDRCHRIGQKKPVNVVYFDCGATIDEAMAVINLRKKENSAILLADGSEIGNRQGLSYKDLSGLIGNLLSVIRSHRTGWIEASPENKNLPIPAAGSILEDTVEGKVARNRLSYRGASDGDKDGETKKDIFAGHNGIDDLDLDYFIVADGEGEDESDDDDSTDGSDLD